MYTPCVKWLRIFSILYRKPAKKKNGINWLPLSIIVKGVFDILNRYKYLYDVRESCFGENCFAINRYKFVELIYKKINNNNIKKNSAINC